MDRELRSANLSFRYRLVDIREIDGEQLLESDNIGDNVIAVLTRLRDHRSAIRGIVKRIAGLRRSHSADQLYEYWPSPAH